MIALISTASAFSKSNATPNREDPNMKILMVLTSHAKLGDTGEKTGF
jgi:hypothetical protein